jgi:hypothetical protein
MSMLALLPILLSLAANQTGPRWPAWAEDLAGQLQCGAQLEEIQKLTDREIGEAQAGGAHPLQSQYYIRKRQTRLWLHLDEQRGLASIALDRPGGWRIMSRSLSPLRNLCTGELRFTLRMIWNHELEGAALYLDNREVPQSEWSNGLLLVTAGRHELRFEKSGYEPITKHLELGPSDRGEQRVDLSAEKLVPAKAAR